MGPRRLQGENYKDQLHVLMERELHPETARNIGRLVATSELLSAEAAIAMIVQMKLDPIRKDRDLLDEDIDYQEQLNFG